MARYGSGDVTFFYIDGFQVAGVTTHLEDTQEAMFEDNTGLGETLNRDASANVEKATVQHDGFFDDAATSVVGALDPAAGGKLGAEHTLCYAISGNVAGRSVALVTGALEAKVKKLIERAQLSKLSAEYQVNAALADARILAARATRSTAGNTDTASSDNGSSTASGGTAYLFVDGYTGAATSLAVTVRHSTDNVTFADHSSGIFPNVTAANQLVTKVLSGTINRYTSVKWAWTGGTAPTWTGLAVLVRN